MEDYWEKSRPSSFESDEHRLLYAVLQRGILDALGNVVGGHPEDQMDAVHWMWAQFEYRDPSYCCGVTAFRSLCAIFGIDAYRIQKLVLGRVGEDIYETLHKLGAVRTTPKGDGSSLSS